jgi:hypothetical protein
MWYESKKDLNVLDYGKPIFCVIRGDLHLLTPQVNEDYEVIRFGWLNVKKGEYNSCSHFSTAELAVKSYKTYLPFNGTIKAK